MTNSKNVQVRKLLSQQTLFALAARIPNDVKAKVEQAVLSEWELARENPEICIATTVLLSLIEMLPPEDRDSALEKFLSELRSAGKLSILHRLSTTS